MAKQTLTVQLMHANARIVELEALLARERVCTEYFNSERVAPKTVAVRKPLPPHFAAAREMAMRSGKCVRVSV